MEQALSDTTTVTLTLPKRNGVEGIILQEESASTEISSDMIMELSTEPTTAIVNGNGADTGTADTSEASSTSSSSAPDVRNRLACTFALATFVVNSVVQTFHIFSLFYYTIRSLAN